jgi:hypothetical protein
MTPGGVLLARTAGVESVWFGDTCVVFDPATNLVRRLNPTAAVVWRILEHPCSRADLIGMALDRMPIADPDAPDAVLRFCDELVAWGLVMERAA